jgi:hypothetical protein
MSSSFRVIAAAVVNATACVVLAHGDAAAQTCSISSTAPGPLSCSVTTTMHMSLRIPSMVGVTMTSPAASSQTSPVVRAGLSVKTNRSYSVQIASAPDVPAGPPGSTAGSAPRVTWATAGERAPLDENPTQIDAYDGPSDDRTPIEVAFARESRRDVSPLDPIRLILTVVAP